MNTKNIFKLSFLLSLILLVTACDDDGYEIPGVNPNLQNDVIKRSIGPNIVGMDIDFAYAMALPADQGKIMFAEVEASIPGSPGTFLENHSYHTDDIGADVGVKIGNPSTTDGTLTRVDFTIDTSAVTLRYKYVIPEEARGQSVSFDFSATSSNGQQVQYTMGPYDITDMDMVLNLEVKHQGKSFISLEDMAVYDAAEAAANPEKIDLIYVFNFIPDPEIPFFHGLVSPVADPEFRPGVTIPSGVNKDTKIRKDWALQDRQLAGLQYGIFIDDLDFQELDMENDPNYAINLKVESGVWVESGDGRYRAYIYFNSTSIADESAVISMKRYEVR